MMWVRGSAFTHDNATTTTTTKPVNGTVPVTGYPVRKVFRIGTVRYNWPMSAHASQGFSIAHCTHSEDLPPVTSCDRMYDSTVQLSRTAEDAKNDLTDILYTTTRHTATHNNA